MGLRTRLIAAARAAYAEITRSPPTTTQPVPSPTKRPIAVAHRDVGKSDPIAFCDGNEFALCTEDWLDVTCPACHEKRHPQAPLSNRERMSGMRATGPGTMRRLAPEEILYDSQQRDLQRGRR